MSYQSQPPQPTGDRWNDWATRLNTYLNCVRTQLQHRFSGESAEQDGVILYDPTIDHIVVSSNGVFEPLSYGHNCRGVFFTNDTHSAASTNTAYAITWEETGIEEDVSIDEDDDSRIVFARSGTYKIDFSAELLSSNSSSKTIYLWPRINGTDIVDSGLTSSISNNGDRLAVARSGIFPVNAGDYLQAMYAVSNTGLSIDGSAATAFSPNSPSAVITVLQIR